jgi:hypothetical protein
VTARFLRGALTAVAAAALAAVSVLLGSVVARWWADVVALCLARS